MTELKVECECGQRYKFDVEPVNGKMPFTVNCPVCGREGTEKANALLRPLPTQQVDQPSPVGMPKLRISSSAQPPASSPPPIGSASPATSRPIAGLARPVTNAGTSGKKPPSFGMGLLGGLLGALVGAATYFLIFKYTGLRFKLLAVGVGGLAGWGAELLGRGEGSKELAVITAILALVGIVTAQYFVAMSWWHEALDNGVGNSAYAISVKEAKMVVKIVPIGSDSEIRNYLAKEAAEDGDKPNPSSVSDDEVKQFRDKNLPDFQDLASGKVTKAQYDAKNGIDPVQEEKEKKSEDDTFQGVFLLLLFSRTNIFSLAAAAVLAFKLSANA